MSERGRPTTGEAAEISLSPTEGWHCNHLFYQFDRARLAGLDAAAIEKGRAELIASLDKDADGSPARLQTSVVSGHKADFGLMVLDSDPLVVDAVHQRLLASTLGPALVPTYSFVSMTEVSEYVPTVQQYGARLVIEGETVAPQDYPSFREWLNSVLRDQRRSHHMRAG